MSDLGPNTTLNPSIVGQAEKAHTAVLRRVLSGTKLDEQQWITVQLALAAGESVGRGDLIARVAAAAKFDPATVRVAIASLIQGGLVGEVAGGHDELSVTTSGQELITALRRRIADVIGPAYSSVPPKDLATAAQVLTAITAILSKDVEAS